MFDPLKNRPIGEAEVREKFGVGPEKVVEVLALIGDTSDNVPGVPGIGPKTAAELIGMFGDLDAVLARAGEIKQPKRREALLANIDKAKLSRDLVQLKFDVELPQPVDAFALKVPDPQALTAFLEKQGFRSVVARLKTTGVLAADGAAAPAPEPAAAPSPAARPAPSKPKGPSLGPGYSLVQDEALLDRWIETIKTIGHVSINVETTSPDPMRARAGGHFARDDAERGLLHPGRPCRRRPARAGRGAAGRDGRPRPHRRRRRRRGDARRRSRSRATSCWRS